MQRGRAVGARELRGRGTAALAGPASRRGCSHTDVLYPESVIDDHGLRLYYPMQMPASAGTALYLRTTGSPCRCVGEIDDDFVDEHPQ